MNSDDKKKNKLPGSLALVLIVLAFVLDIAGDSNSVSISISALGIAAVVIAVLFAVKRLRGAKSGDKEAREASPGKAAAPQRETALHFDMSKERSEGKYASYDHDTAHRLEQLDSFLKNGIIDKKEYRLLKERYLRGK